MRAILPNFATRFLCMGILSYSSNTYTYLHKLLNCCCHQSGLLQPVIFVDDGGKPELAPIIIVTTRKSLFLCMCP